MIRGLINSSVSLIMYLKASRTARSIVGNRERNSQDLEAGCSSKILASRIVQLQTRNRNVCLFRLLMGSCRNSVDSYKYAIFPHNTIRAIIMAIREANTL